MTLLQMAAMYQAIANDGVRIAPRIIVDEGTGAHNSAGTDQTRPEGVRVVSPATAKTVREMFRAVVQNDPMGVQMGTGTKAAIPGIRCPARPERPSR